MQYQLDYEKLGVYPIELQFVAWATDLMAELSGSPEARTRRIIHLHTKSVPGFNSPTRRCAAIN